MSLNRIKDAILNEAKKEADELIKAAQNNFQKTTEEERVKREESFKKRLTKIQDELEREKEKNIIELRINYKMKLLATKNKVIEEIFTKALDKFITCEEYLQIMEVWIKRINEPSVIFMNSHDLKIFNQEYLNKILKNDEVVLNKESININGGFIVETDRYEIDHTIESILNNLEQELAPLISNKLFSA
jgi:V/A-type H+-transporting ATPase subunit E